MTTSNIRLLQPSDVSAVLQIQAACYSADLLEREDCFLHKMRVFPKGCLGEYIENNPVAYLFVHPWMLDKPMPLDDTSYEIPPSPDCMYFHDVSVMPFFRGKSCARQLVDAALKVAEGMNLKKYALVAVQNSEEFWERWGFKKSHTMKYGQQSATYMTCRRPPQWH